MYGVLVSLFYMLSSHIISWIKPKSWQFTLKKSFFSSVYEYVCSDTVMRFVDIFEAHVPERLKNRTFIQVTFAKKFNLGRTIFGPWLNSGVSQLRVGI